MFNHDTFLNSQPNSGTSIWLLIRKGIIKNAGNKKLKIYGTLACRSGKRMKTVNRVFFTGEEEAINQGYRPCGHCMKTAFQVWKQQQNN